MRCSTHHMRLNEQGEGKCSVPMWREGIPTGFCDAAAYGPPAPCLTYRRADTGEVRRLDGKYSGYVPGLACPAHGGPTVRLFMDGDSWCAVFPDFVNLAVSKAGFGVTQEAAMADLLT